VTDNRIFEERKQNIYDNDGKLLASENQNDIAVDDPDQTFGAFIYDINTNTSKL
jgi:hypothetical protein